VSLHLVPAAAAAPISKCFGIVLLYDGRFLLRLFPLIILTCVALISFIFLKSHAMTEKAGFQIEGRH
jgi:hypothetical protein